VPVCGRKALRGRIRSALGGLLLRGRQRVVPAVAIAEPARSCGCSTRLPSPSAEAPRVYCVRSRSGRFQQWPRWPIRRTVTALRAAGTRQPCIAADRPGRALRVAGHFGQTRPCSISDPGTARSCRSCMRAVRTREDAHWCWHRCADWIGNPGRIALSQFASRCGPFRYDPANDTPARFEFLRDHLKPIGKGRFLTAEFDREIRPFPDDIPQGALRPRGRGGWKIARRILSSHQGISRRFQPRHPN